MDQGQAASQHDAELQRVHRYLAADPNNPLLLAKAIDICLAVGRVDEAAKYSDRARSVHPEDQALMHRHALVLIAQRRFADAIDVLRPLAAGHPELNIAYNLALAYFNSGEHALAREVLLSQMRSGPVWVPALTLCLRAAHHLGELDDALAMFRGHEAQCRNDPEPLAVASLIALDADDLDAAARWSTAALSTGSRPAEALIAAGSVALARRDLELASALFGECTSAEPSQPRAWSGLGMSSLIAGDVAAAKRQLSTSASQAPSDPMTLQTLAWCLVMDGDAGSACDVLQRALALDDDVASLHGTLAVAHALCGDTAAARSCIGRAAQIDAEDISVELARAYLSGRTIELERLRQHAAALVAAGRTRGAK